MLHAILAMLCLFSPVILILCGDGLRLIRSRQTRSSGRIILGVLSLCLLMLPMCSSLLA